jgi:hypothetical protein
MQVQRCPALLFWPVGTRYMHERTHISVQLGGFKSDLANLNPKPFSPPRTPCAARRSESDFASLPQSTISSLGLIPKLDPKP